MRRFDGGNPHVQLWAMVVAAAAQRQVEDLQLRESSNPVDLLADLRLLEVKPSMGATGVESPPVRAKDENGLIGIARTEGT